MSDQPSQAAVAYNNPDFDVRVPPDLTRLGDTLPARVGAPAPEFEAQLLDGGTFRLSDARGKRHVVLMMGAISSPMTAIQLPAMNELWREFGPKGVDFYLVYVKESHPAETYSHHSSMEQKVSYARELQRLEKPAFPMLVDSLDGHIHRNYGQWPVSLFVVHKDGRLVFRSTIAQPVQLRSYLAELMEWEDLMRAHPDHVSHTGYTEFV
ncbi:MAG TPA: redoxin domain-containing protein, partial [Chloroflexota bacterium]|nr:redoxin domain-containing protein [Chloroflexota bacterium]